MLREGGAGVGVDWFRGGEGGDGDLADELFGFLTPFGLSR